MGSDLAHTLLRRDRMMPPRRVLAEAESLFLKRGGEPPDEVACEFAARQVRTVEPSANESRWSTFVPMPLQDMPAVPALSDLPTHRQDLRHQES